MNDEARLIETIETMLRAAGWQGTLDELQAAGSTPSDFITKAIVLARTEGRLEEMARNIG